MSNALTIADLMRNAVGYDRLPSFFDNVTSNFPPHNIERINENTYRLTLAVAGFGREDIEVAIHGDELTVKGSKSSETTTTYLYRGIAFRDFSRSFKIGEYIEVDGASLENGLLVIDLVRNVPDAAKPKRIEIR